MPLVWSLDMVLTQRFHSEFHLPCEEDLKQLFHEIPSAFLQTPEPLLHSSRDKASPNLLGLSACRGKFFSSLCSEAGSAQELGVYLVWDRLFY